MKKKKFFLKTFGCQMNVADSEYFASILLSTGDFEVTNDIKEADVIVVNTCSVRKHAEDRESSFIGRLKKFKDESKTIIVLGCFAQKAKEELKRKFPFIDIIVGPLEYEYLPEILKERLGINSLSSNIHFNIFDKVSVFVPIMTGCNNYCSYCIVPYVRGREKSRPVRDILNEIKCLLDKGVKEVVLLGQNVNSYSGLKSDSIKINFANLLEEIASLDSKEKFWIGFLTNHPKDMTYDIVKTIKSYPNISRHIHLPLQSGSNRILKLMNRNYTFEKYKELVELIRREIPDVSITTDLIVGFPTEQEEDFQQTIKAVKEIEFDSAFVFKYSVREKTKSAELPDDVEDEVKERRHYELLNLCDTIARQKNKNYINSEVEVLVVSKSDKKNVFLGKTINDRIVEICSDRDLLGNFVKVKIKDVKFHTLIGEVLK